MAEKKMVKLVVQYKLKEGVDPEKFWQWYEDNLAAEFKQTPGLRRYVLNRLTEVHKGDDKGKAPFWGMTEMYFDSLEAFEKRHGGGEASEVHHLLDSMTVEHTGVFVEEKIIVGNQGLT